jgi:hypothetical protein
MLNVDIKFDEADLPLSDGVIHHLMCQEDGHAGDLWHRSTKASCMYQTINVGAAEDLIFTTHRLSMTHMLTPTNGSPVATPRSRFACFTIVGPRGRRRMFGTNRRQRNQPVE